MTVKITMGKQAPSFRWKDPKAYEPEGGNTELVHMCVMREDDISSEPFLQMAYHGSSPGWVPIGPGFEAGEVLAVYPFYEPLDTEVLYEVLNGNYSNKEPWFPQFEKLWWDAV